MVWSINGCAGAGDWLADTAENRALLEAQIQAGRRFGPHDLETRRPTSPVGADQAARA